MKKHWWQEGVVYQIYPRSFQDSNADGVGDLRGILDRVDYLSDLGVTAVWLSPVYPSPNVDNGYDVADYQCIAPQFGTLQDWDALCAALHARGIRVIMDWVVNHSSDEHPWFAESAASRENAKADYYIWRDPVNGGVPNNWRSCWGGSAWEYVPARGQYYLHLFSKKQPDLNWACAEMREKIYDMMEWWVQRGVDGFRVDAISYLDKPADFPDAAGEAESDGYVLCMNQLTGREKTHVYIHGMQQRLKKYGDVLMIGEVVARDQAHMRRYIAPQCEEFSMAIPFVPPIVEINTWSPAALLRRVAQDWSQTDCGAWWARFLSNHDKPRQVSLYANDGEYWEQSAKMLAAFLYTLPGTPFLYQGEELGMTNVSYAALEDYDDIDTKTFFESLVLGGTSRQEAFALAKKVSRDNARTPMQWDESPNAGFSAGTPWLGVNPNYRRINARAQRKDPLSVWSFYRRLIALRKENPALIYGDFTPLCDPAQEDVLLYTRSFGQETWLVVHNWSALPHNMPEEFAGLGQPLLSGSERQGGYTAGKLRPYETAIWKLKISQKNDEISMITA
ncbi:MAG: alpha-glucosidase [Eubacteriales bacterium]|nr:alpha-glucosidase [Eubacteriales bacterium]